MCKQDEKLDFCNTCRKPGVASKGYCSGCGNPYVMWNSKPAEKVR